MNKKFFRIFIPLIALIILAVAVIPADACRGCTLTIGYWRTHSSYGPAAYDEAWTGHEDLPFFSSGLTNYQILWKPARGNAYIILAKQWIGAKLNWTVGAGTIPEVDDALAWGTNYFSTHDLVTGNKKPIRAQAIYYAGILDQYNKGEIGPGHCED